MSINRTSRRNIKACIRRTSSYESAITEEASPNKHNIIHTVHLVGDRDEVSANTATRHATLQEATTIELSKKLYAATPWGS